VEYFQIHIFVSAPQRLTGKLSKILSFPQMGHKHVIKGIQARATRTRAPVNYLTAIKGTHAQPRRPHANDLIRPHTTSYDVPKIGVEITTAQQLASTRHISVKEIFSIPRTCNFNSK